jgi:hypothetical protein
MTSGLGNLAVKQHPRGREKVGQGTLMKRGGTRLNILADIPAFQFEARNKLLSIEAQTAACHPKSRLPQSDVGEHIAICYVEIC